MKTTSIFIIISLANMSNIAHANVSKYHSCPQNGVVRVPENASGHLWSDDCATLYVLPSIANVMNVESISSEVSETECAAIESVIKSHAAKIAQLKVQMSRPGVNEREIVKIYEKIARLRKNQERLDRQRLSYLDRKGKIKVPLIATTNNITFIKDEIALCTQRAQSCRQLEKDLQIQIENKHNLETGIMQIDSILATLVEQDGELERQVQDFQKIAGNLTPSDEVSLHEITNVLNELDTLTSKYSHEAGGIIKVYMENKHMDVLKDYQSMNRNLNIARIPTQSSVQFNVAGLDGALQESITIDKISIPGIASTQDEVEDGYANILFGESLSGSVHISKMSACLLKRAEATRDDHLAKFTVNMLYKYQASVKSSYQLTYNFKKIYSKIRNKRSQGGLFKTKNIISLVQETNMDESLKVKFYSEDPRDNYDKLEKEKLKANFLARTIAHLSSGLVSFSPREELTMPTARNSGAQSGSTFMKDKNNCDAKWCKYGAFSLDLSQDLFGDNATAAEYLEKFNYNSVEEFNETETNTYYGTSTFKSGI